MIRRLTALALAAALAAAALACDEEEVLPPDTLPTVSGDVEVSSTPSPLPPTPSATTSPTDGPSDGLLIYTDPVYGYSFNYPTHWFLISHTEAGGLTALYSYDPTRVEPGDAGRPVSPDELKMEFIVVNNPEQMALETWIARDRDKGAPVTVSSRSEELIAGRPTIRETVELGPGSSAVQYFVGYGERVIVIAVYPADSTRLAELDRVLASFDLAE
jgi:hypothetical protein